MKYSHEGVHQVVTCSNGRVFVADILFKKGLSLPGMKKAKKEALRMVKQGWLYCQDHIWRKEIFCSGFNEETQKEIIEGGFCLNINAKLGGK